MTLAFLLTRTTVIPKKPDYGDTLRPLDSYGASKEEIFYFESYVQTYKLWGLAGLADSMEKGVEQFENRPEWKKKMAALNKSIERVSKQADDLYEEIGNTLVRSPNLSPPSEDAAKASEGVEDAGDGAQ